MKNWIKTYVLLVAITSIFITSVQAQTTGTFDIHINNSGSVVSSSGSGYGSSWYWYPGLQQNIMWFHSDGYDPNLIGVITLTVLVESLDPSEVVYFNIGYGWSRDTWSNTSTPPLPGSVSPGTENSYFSLRTARTEDTGHAYLEPGESVYITRDVEIQNYFPEWFYISVSGANIKVSQTISLAPAEKVEESIVGACCNTDNGDCYITETGNCLFSGYIYLGDGSSCSSCETQNFTLDYGDAPSQYPVTQSRNGARHDLTSNLMYLGFSVNGELDGQPSTQATQDPFDDGVSFNTNITTGQSASVTVTASNLGVINAWLDLNLDGDWSDAGEHIIADEPVITGQNTISFYIPITATTGLSYARFRYNSTGGLGATGLASDGEVEDYAVTINSGSGSGTDPNTTDPNTTPATIEPVSPANQFASKWNQPVDLLGTNSAIVYGWNIVTRYSSIPLIADDWRNADVLPIQGFRWWGAFDNWIYSEMPLNMPTGFHFGIWTNNPTLGKPGSLVWEQTSSSWAWAYTGQVQDALGQTGGEAVFEFSTLLSQDQWFYPSTAPNTVYWLSITPIYSSTTVSPTPWGWMTRQSDGTAAERILSVYNPSTWPPQLGATYAAGSSVTSPSTQNWDMAFELITSQPGGGSSSGGANSDLANAIGDLNDDGKIDINDLYILLGFVLNP